MILSEHIYLSGASIAALGELEQSQAERALWRRYQRAGYKTGRGTSHSLRLAADDARVLDGLLRKGLEGLSGKPRQAVRIEFVAWSAALDRIGRGAGGASEAEESVVRKIPAWLLACDEGGEWAGADGIALLVEPEREVEIGSILQHLESRFGLSLSVFRERWADRGRVGLVLRYDDGVEAGARERS